MEDDKQAIVVGLGAGLGGFAGLLILGCLCWQICCGSWCEKKPVQPVTVLTKNQRRRTIATQMQNNLSTITPMKQTNLYPHPKSNPSNDLAGRLQPAR